MEDLVEDTDGFPTDSGRQEQYFAFRRVAIVDDDHDFANSLVDLLSAYGYDVRVAYSDQEAIRLLREFDAQVALLDIRLGTTNATDLIPKFKEIRPYLTCVMITGFAVLDTAIAALRKGAYDYLRKPVQPQDLLFTLERCVEKSRLEFKQVEAERALKKSEELYRTLAESVGVGIWRVDVEGGTLYLNPTMCLFLGIASTECQQVLNIKDVVDRDASSFILGAEPPGGRGLTHEIELIGRSGEKRNLMIARSPVRDVDGSVHSYIATFTDISERKVLEEQLLQAKKMQAIGELAGGIAHDFNNLLGGILGYANLLKLNARRGETVYEAAEVIEKAGERAADLTAQLLGFARRGKNQNGPVDLHVVSREVIKLLSRSVDKRIVIREELKAPSSVILGDPSQIQQVILNLMLNACDALENRVGMVTVSSKIQTVDRSSRGPSATLQPGRYVVLSVRDTGHGIPKDILPRIFEPFFTTKAPGKGTGMGLAMVYGIVKNHGGIVTVDTADGEGSVFDICLPTLRETTPAATTPENSSVVSGSGTILVVDDDEIMRAIARDMLRVLGYKIVLAKDGEEGVELYRARHPNVDLVLLDMNMPKLGGRDAFIKMKEIDPDVCAVLATGYALNEEAQGILNLGVKEFVQKPFKISELSQIVARNMTLRKKPAG